MRDGVRRRYEAKAEAGELEPNEGQRLLADKLDALALLLEDRARKSKTSALGWLLASGARPSPPRGLYVWGPVGSGKTLLMDVFFGAVALPRKRRVHFHAFMAEVHDRLAAARRRVESGERSADDPIASVAAEIAKATSLLCFDEFAVHDIADAMILGRLVEQILVRGVTIVTTSNLKPDDQYKDGLNRALFLPFIAMLKERMEVFALRAPRDYRLDPPATRRRYVTPLGPEADACLDAHFRRLAGRAHGTPRELAHKGRSIHVPEAADGIARVDFRDLCARPLGAGDYLAIASAFHTVIVADIPALGHADRNEARRLINLIDTFYDRRVRLIVSAADEPEGIFRGLEGSEALDLARAVSRLSEMRSDAYWDATPREWLNTKTARVN